MSEDLGFAAADQNEVSRSTGKESALWADDLDFQEVEIKSVRPEMGGGWSIERSDGWSFYVPAESPVEPLPGMVARFYGRGIGYVVRGLLIDGQCVFYRTPDEQAAYADEMSYGKDCAELLDRWDNDRGVWSVAMGGFGTGYEQALQLTAFEMLRRIVETAPDPESLTDEAAWKVIRDDLSTVVTPIVEPLGLSGAQWGAAMSLAAMFYRQGPVKAMRTADRERHIQVSKNFPRLSQ